MTLVPGFFARVGGRLLRTGAALLLGLAALAAAAGTEADLRQRYAQVREQLRDNPYQRAVHIDSADGGDTLRGDVYAVLDHPFHVVSGALKDPAGWCAILILPFNTKYCRPDSHGNGATTLVMRIGRKADQALADTYRIDFDLRPVARDANYFESSLLAQKGPLGTHDYRIVLAALPLDGHRTFLHLTYGYGYGGIGRMAMQAYLGTVGASKVGFSVAGRDGDGRPLYVGGMRGAIERNVMRYFLAIDAHLASLSAPPDQQLDRRIEAWFNATERYARQLHEMDRATYVALKRGEYRRQQTLLQ